MEFAKKIEEIKFDNDGVSEPIAMASAAGWYVGSIDNSEGFIQPYDRYTDYMTKEEATATLESTEMFWGVTGEPVLKFDYILAN